MRYLITFALGAMIGAGVAMAWAFIDAFEESLDPERDRLK